MAYIRRRGKLWQATVRLPDGTRSSRSHPLRSVVKEWADDLEADLRRGEALDPKAGRVTVGELWEKTRESRRLELASRRRDVSQWRNHVAPRWAGQPVGPITRPDVRAWVVDMAENGVGAATIQGSLNVLRAVLHVAVDSKIIRENPAVGVSGPRPAAHQDRVLSPEEDEALLAVLPDRPDGRLLVELMRYCGCRWEEAAAIRRERVLQRDQLISLGPVVERNRTVREYPKSPAGERPVPVDDDLWPRVCERVLAVPPRGLLVAAPDGGVLDYSNWYHRTWRPALRDAGLDDPQPTPHDLRHTYGTKLAEAGVPVHEIMSLMGHEKLSSVERYLHPGAERFSRAREAIEKSRGVQSGRASCGRQEPSTASHRQPLPTTETPAQDHDH